MTGHTYPSNYSPPFDNEDMATAWRGLDMIPVDTLSNEQRAFLAGFITGALFEARKEGYISGSQQPKGSDQNG
jgi:hypothetical protein